MELKLRWPPSIYFYNNQLLVLTILIHILMDYFIIYLTDGQYGKILTVS